MKAIVVTDQAAGTAGMTLVERPEPQAAINDVVVEVHGQGTLLTVAGSRRERRPAMDERQGPLSRGLRPTLAS